MGDTARVFSPQGGVWIVTAPIPGQVAERAALGMNSATEPYDSCGTDVSGASQRS